VIAKKGGNMALTRREFLKWSSTASAAAAALCLGFDLRPVQSYAAELKILKAKETTTICPYCAVGCGIIAHSKKTGRLINTEGDPDHPINEGSLCSKGAALFQMTENKARIKNPLYRAAESDEWEEIEWDEALEKIAEKVKATRDATFTQKNAKGQVVNRTAGIAHVGSAALDNEECWVLQGVMRALGLVFIEHQARI
jgi:formate dehydrogenase major subunit